MIIMTDTGVVTVWDGARLIHEEQMTVHQLAALQVSGAQALRRALAWPGIPNERRSPMEHERDI